MPTVPPSVEHLPIGTRVRVVFEGTVEADSGYRYGGTKAVRIDNVSRFIGATIAKALNVHQIADPAPEWQAGDVIVLRFTEGGDRFTYVRGVNGWVTDRSPLGSSRVNALWAKGLVEHVLRDGKPVPAKTPVTPPVPAPAFAPSRPSLRPLPTFGGSAVPRPRPGTAATPFSRYPF